jgi:hypothetical protein
MSVLVSGFVKIALGAGETATITTDALSTARWGQLSSQTQGGVSDVPAALTNMAASSTVVLGGQATPSRWLIEATAGQVTYVTAPASPPVPEIGNPASVVRLFGAGAPTGTTGLGMCGPASLYIDTTAGQVYINSGTALSPSWNRLIESPAAVTQLYGSGAPTGTTGQGVAGTGSIYFDTTNAQAYLNSGSSASPVWKELSRAA